MKVTFIDFKREWKFFEKEFIRSFREFGRSGYYVLGPEVEKFEKDFAKFCGYKYTITVSTGLSALEIILRAYNIGIGDEVITVANSAVATSLSISNVGAKPIFCDIGDDFLINAYQIQKLITSRTKAILPVHLFGNICDMEKINKIAKNNNLVVIEDACQAHGSDFHNHSAINTKAFSFYPTKNLGALGEGGAIVTNDKRIKEFAESYRNYGQQGRYNHVIKGGNYRLDPLKCKLLGIKLKHIKKFTANRQKIAHSYIDALSEIKSLLINKFDSRSAYHLFVIRALGGRRNDLKSYLEKNGIDSLIHYPVPIHHQLCYKKEYLKLSLENTDRFQEEILSLPCNPFLTNREIDFVISEIKEFYLKIKN
jgi:dTDP-4-amino-4,6-dideoxygalactose transaminase